MAQPYVSDPPIDLPLPKRYFLARGQLIPLFSLNGFYTETRLVELRFALRPPHTPPTWRGEK